MTTARRDDFGYLFVVTYGRSGSTLLMGLLNSIPGYLIRGEWRREGKRHEARRDHEGTMETEHLMTLTRQVPPVASIQDFSGQFHPFGLHAQRPRHPPRPRLGP